MPKAIIAGLPPDTERRVRSALHQRPEFGGNWNVIWYRSKGRIPGLAPSQVGELQGLAASHPHGAQILVFRSEVKRDQEFVKTEIAPFFRLRWLEYSLLRLVPHSIQQFFDGIETVLDEEMVWIESVKPMDESSCLLLPECSFSCDPSINHLWTTASEPGLERIRQASAACEKFKALHWTVDTRQRNSRRSWVDMEGRVFEHRGQRHGTAPFPRSWKYSYQVPDGFHYDVQSLDERPFHVQDSGNYRHKASSLGHINIDSHGYVR